jgi:hypothetical protein
MKAAVVRMAASTAQRQVLLRTFRSKLPPAAPPSSASMPSIARPALLSVSMGARHMSTNPAT